MKTKWRRNPSIQSLSPLLTFLAIYMKETLLCNLHYPLGVNFLWFKFSFSTKIVSFFHQKQSSVQGVECNTCRGEAGSEIAKNLMLLVPVHLGRSLSSALGVGFLFSLRRRGAQTQTYFFKRVEKMAAALPRELQYINTHITHRDSVKKP